MVHSVHFQALLFIMESSLGPWNYKHTFEQCPSSQGFDGGSFISFVFFSFLVQLSPITCYVQGTVLSIGDAEMSEPWSLLPEAHHVAGWPGTCTIDEHHSAAQSGMWEAQPRGKAGLLLREEDEGLCQLWRHTRLGTCSFHLCSVASSFLQQERLIALWWFSSTLPAGQVSWYGWRHPMIQGISTWLGSGQSEKNHVTDGLRILLWQ